MKSIELVINPATRFDTIYSFDENYIKFNEDMIAKPVVSSFWVEPLSFVKILREAECSFCKGLFDLNKSGWGNGYCPSCNSDYNSGWRKKK